MISTAFRSLDKDLKTVFIYPHTLEVWVIEVFNLKMLPFYFHKHKNSFKDFQEYVLAKGNYQPNPTFLNKVLQLIQNDQYPSRETLQSLETNIFYNSDNLKTFATQVVEKTTKSTRWQRQSTQCGFYIEALPQLKKGKKVTSLIEACCEVLRKNGYPQFFISDKKVKAIVTPLSDYSSNLPRRRVVEKATQSLFWQRQSDKLGFYIEALPQPKKGVKVTSLVEACCEALRKNGYPQFFIISNKIKAIV